MASNRINRINEEMQKSIAGKLRSVKDPRVAGTMISVTRVETTPDLRYAKVYVSFLEENKAKEALKNKTDNPFQSVILYDLGVSDLSSKEKTRLELMADMIKNGPSDRVYKLEGHADKQTGTAEVNKRIAAARAKKAYDFLVSKGVNPDQLTYDSFGDTANPYNGAKANRVVVIK